MSLNSNGQSTEVHLLLAEGHAFPPSGTMPIENRQAPSNRVFYRREWMTSCKGMSYDVQQFPNHRLSANGA